MSELKPCPRCGAEAHVVTEDGEPTMFLCEDCGYWLDVSEFETTENAFKWWNDRPFIDALQARITELEAAQRWIPVSEPPVEGQYCAIMQLDKYGQVVEQGFAIYYGERYDYTMEVWKNITHWYPVPNWNAIELREVQE